MTLPPPPPTGPAPARRGVVIGVLVALLLALTGLVLFLPGGPFNPDEPSTGSTPPPVDVAPTPAETPEPVAPEASGPTEADRAQMDAVFASLVRRDATDPAALGAVDAPVVMIAWADFRCGHCAEYAVMVEPALRAEYVEQGVLRIEWRDFARVTPESASVAAAARAAGVQGEFWAFHDALFADLLEGSTVSDDYLRDVAARVGLDVARFDADRASPEVLAAVQAEGEEAAVIGVSGTPTFLVNGSPMVGAQSLDTFRAVIEAELARATG